MFNSKFNVNRIEWLDLVFENRNQSYGAYVLRKESGKDLRNAVIIAAFLFAGGIVISSMVSKIGNKLRNVVVTIDKPDDLFRLSKVDVLKPPTVKVPKVNEVVAKPIQTQKFNQVNYKTPHVVADTKPTADLPDINTLKESLIGNETVNNGADAPSDANGTTATTSGNVSGDVADKEVFSTADFLEKYPEFPGGMQAWQKFLSKNLRYPYLAQENQISGRVFVSFVVERNGEITNLKIVRGIGGGCDEEALRVIKKSPFWSPGFQNGRAVRVAYTMPIYFKMAE